jgi:hypothetical protein
MIHEIEVSNLMFNKTSNEEIKFKKYDINVDLEEEFSNDEKTVLKYSLDLTSNPKNAVINISGNTILSGEQSEIEEFLKQAEEKTPEVVSLIYQELFPLMYIISKNMKIPSPAHTISQNNVKDEQLTEKSETPNEKPVETQSSDNTNELEATGQEVKESEKVEIKTDGESEIKEEQNNEDKT